MTRRLIGRSLGGLAALTTGLVGGIALWCLAATADWLFRLIAQPGIGP